MNTNDGFEFKTPDPEASVNEPEAFHLPESEKITELEDSNPQEVMKGSALSTVLKFLFSSGNYSLIFTMLVSLIILKYLEIRCDTWLYIW
jgi:hypothetical protein